jgi:hypothetical protein
MHRRLQKRPGLDGSLKQSDLYLVSFSYSSQRPIKFDIEMDNLKKQIAFFECLQGHCYVKGWNK